ncbi:hypothetical protein N0B31_21555 (plasmid) [Salinirubellus salinus]|uniref:Uncharacterized protein n=1 Tax=Salinirubellus salinus TaxID=1364945 RepID=A0A9E7U727_9EURY|nr:hypothetical protein [Salinirubellus salinus]UWM56990.1 hypothetical protein N0B31_22350 [Salinirubellus salinus]UWM57030.1 hypothetical protein N0B31_21555 [Salinirubellus salinus]
MGEITHNTHKIDEESQRLAGELYREGSLTTSDVRELLACKNGKANGKIDQLVRPGFAEAPTPEKKPGEPWPPKEIELTERGRRWVEKHRLHEETPGSVEDRMDAIESRLNRVEERQRQIIRILRGGESAAYPTVPQAVAGVYGINRFLSDSVDEFDGELPDNIERRMKDLEEDLDGL